MRMGTGADRAGRQCHLEDMGSYQDPFMIVSWNEKCRGHELGSPGPNFDSNFSGLPLGLKTLPLLLCL